MTIPAILVDAEDAYARAVIEADLIRSQQVTAIRTFIASLAATRHDGGLTVDQNDLTLTLNREETRLEMAVTADAQLLGRQPGYQLIMYERWAKTMKRAAAAPPPMVAGSADAIVDRMMRMYLRFRNDIQTFEHDLAIAAERSSVR